MKKPRFQQIFDAYVFNSEIASGLTLSNMSEDEKRFVDLLNSVKEYGEEKKSEFFGQVARVYCLNYISPRKENS